MARLRRVLAGAAAVTVMTVTGIVAFTGTASASVTGWENQHGASLSDSASVKVAVAPCTGGKLLVGAAGWIDDGDGEVHIESIRPSATSVEVVAYEDEDGYAGNWTVNAEAICTDPLAGLEIITATSVASSYPNKFAIAECTGNRKVVGAAAEISGGGGQVVINKIAPLDDRVNVSAYEDGTGTTNVWNVKAYAICADAGQLTGRHIDSYTGTRNSDDYKANPAACAQDEVLTGGGAYIYPYTGEVSFSFYPVDFSGGFQFMHVEAHEDGNGTGSTWEITTYIVCVDE
jgi:hypothetical protein